MNVGIDIVDVDRIDRLMNRYGKKFLDRIFSFEEKKLFENRKINPQSIAGRFALKEAFIKAYGVKIPFREIKIFYTQGKPYIDFHGNVFEGVSISHEKKFAVGVVVINEDI